MRLERVAKRYRRRDSWVVQDVDLSLEAGSVTVLSGANGSGKSTLLRMIGGLSQPTRGMVRDRPARMAVMPDRFVAPSRMTGRSYLSHLGRVRGMAGADLARRADELAEAFAITPGLDTAMHLLSKGNAQKIGLAQVFLAPVDLLVLDEPYVALDAQAAAALDGLIDAARADGATVVLSEPGDRRSLEGATRYAIAAGRVRPIQAPPTRPQPSRVLVRLQPTRPGTALEPLTAVPGVAVAPTGEGEVVTLAVERETVDRLLLLALGSGWSVREVRAQTAPSSPGKD